MFEFNVCFAPGGHHVASEDSYAVLSGEDLVVLGVADGVGSCRYAADASEIAVDTVLRFVSKNYPSGGEVIPVKRMLSTAFSRAQLEIEREAQAMGRAVAEYDTTLSLFLHDVKRNRSFIAHVGDGGIILRKRDGSYAVLSEKQQQDGCVFPLRSGYTHWQIEALDEEPVSVLLATDGLYDAVCREELPGGLYFPLLSLLSDPFLISRLRRRGVETNFVSDPVSLPRKQIYQAIYETLRRNYRIKRQTALNLLDSIKRGGMFDLLAAVRDDKTAVCCYRTEGVVPVCESRAFLEPDWQAVAAQRQRRLYPSRQEDTVPAPEKPTEQQHAARREGAKGRKERRAWLDQLRRIRKRK